ncbi:type VII secretion target [Actinoplanes sp. NPDC051861]|uniref:type VII secretion target n=1 Tax=Actinoplanes sp. NPDC051861 TaxID=3155170 RepID=UPI00342D8806
MNAASDGVDVHPPALRVTADEIRAAGERLDGAWRQHTAAAFGRGEIFGTDPVGSLIGESYRSAMGIADASYSSVAASFSAFADALHTMADDFQHADEDSAGRIAETPRWEPP